MRKDELGIMNDEERKVVTVAAKEIVWRRLRDGLPREGTGIVVEMADGRRVETVVRRHERYSGYALPGVDLGNVILWRYLVEPAAVPLESGVLEEILTERGRQVRELGFDRSHDDRLNAGELVRMAVAYAQFSVGYVCTLGWREDAWGPRPKMSSTRDRDLVKAVALLLAEIERRRRTPEPTAVQEGDIFSDGTLLKMAAETETAAGPPG